METMANPSGTTPLVVVNTTQSFEAACRALEAAIPAHGFGLLGIHDLGDTLRRKGVTLDEQCRIFEVCQPRQAARVLAADLSLNMALPCRLSVYTEAGATRIGMISPVAMLASLSSEPELQTVAAEVEATTRAIIDTAATPGDPA
jgi:uncharacterized protein (DUF302 family)